MFLSFPFVFSHVVICNECQSRRYYLTDIEQSYFSLVLRYVSVVYLKKFNILCAIQRFVGKSTEAVAGSNYGPVGSCPSYNTIYIKINFNYILARLQ
jgi:hypothetical protein